MQVKRCFGTVNVGNLNLGDVRPTEQHLRNYYSYLKNDFNFPEHGYLAGAFALERGKTGNLHIQFYMEHEKKRFRTLANDFDIMETCFQRVKNAKGSWDYCSGIEAHKDKPAYDRFIFGTPKLHGDPTKADLRMLVDLIIDGNELNEIMLKHPYAWCVHRPRLLSFKADWDAVQNGEKVGHYLTFK